MNERNNSCELCGYASADELRTNFNNTFHPVAELEVEHVVMTVGYFYLGFARKVTVRF